MEFNETGEELEASVGGTTEGTNHKAVPNFDFSIEFWEHTPPTAASVQSNLQKLFPAMIAQPGSNPESLAAALNLLIESSGDALKEWAEAAIAKYPEKVAEFKAGKTGLLGLFMGELMKQSKGKADPKAADQILRELLSI